MMAARDIDIKKAMKYILYVSAAGYFLIAFLSVIGKLGVTAQPPHDYGRGVVEMRYELGFGHPNTFYGSVYAFVLLWMWIYGEAATLREWLLVFTLNFIIISSFASIYTIITNPQRKINTYYLRDLKNWGCTSDK